MQKRFHELRERLLQAGVAPRHVRRYLTELADHFADLRAEEERAGHSRTDAETAALARLGGTEALAQVMIERREFQSWCARAPWAIFGFAPLLFLVAAYVIACLNLWLLWQIFLPTADTPFGHANPGPIYGLQNICMQAGKFYYFGAPVLVGWGISLIAGRQRIKAVWLMLGVALLAIMGSANQIYASRTAVPNGLGHISMDFFAIGPTGEGIYGLLFHAAVIFSLAVLPYFLWRLQKAGSLSA